MYRFWVGVWGLWGDDGGGDVVVGVEVDKLAAGGAAAWGYCRPSGPRLRSETWGTRRHG